MVTSALTFSALVIAETWSLDHASIQVYLKYVEDFNKNSDTAQPDRYYVNYCKATMSHYTVIDASNGGHGICIFDQEAYSDVTIKFGTRERKCHRMILCSKSEYFKEMCGPGKAFAEAQQPVIELKDDANEDAVEAMVRWLYTFDYESRLGSDNSESTAEFHLDVCVVADKYMLACLSTEALSRLRVKLERVTEAQLTAVLDKLYFSDAVYPANVVEVVEAVRDTRLRALVKHEAFRSLMRSDADLSMSVVDRLVLDAGKDMKLMYVGTCNICPRKQFGESTGNWEPYCCPNRSCKGTVTKQKLWQEREVTKPLDYGSPA